MKFSKGEIVIMLPAKNPAAIAKYGSGHIECEIFEVGPFKAGYFCSAMGDSAAIDTDYVVKMSDGDLWFCGEPNLRKRPQPGQSDTESRERYLNSLKPCDPEFREDMDKYLNPVTEETMRRVVDGMREFYTRDF